MINLQNIKNFYTSLNKFYKGAVLTVGVGAICSGLYFGAIKPYIDSSATPAYKSIAQKSQIKTSIKTTDKTRKIAKRTTPKFKIIKTGDFDHNRIDDMVLKEIGTNRIEYRFGWFNPKIQKPQYLPYDVLRKRLQKNSPKDVKRYDNLVAKILN